MSDWADGVTATASGAGSWSDWFQDVGKSVIGSASEAYFKSPVDIQKMKIMAYGPDGQPYVEGKAAMPGTGLQIPTSWLLIGGIVALVMVMKD